MKTRKLTIRTDEHLYKYLLKVQNYIYCDTNKLPSLAHVVRHLIGHGIHRRASGCNCKAPNGNHKSNKSSL